MKHISNFALGYLVFAQIAASEMIEDKDFLLFKAPYDSYCKISLLANLTRIYEENKSMDLVKSVSLIELQLVTDLAYLDYVIKDNPDHQYAQYVLNKIIFGFREGYIHGGDNLLSKRLLVNDQKNWHVDMKTIYQNAKIPDEQKLEFGKWYKKYFRRIPKKPSGSVPDN